MRIIYVNIKEMLERIIGKFKSITYSSLAVE